MAPRLIALDPESPDPQPLREVAQALAGGALVSFPTDTVYALACAADDEEAARRIFTAKGRRPDHPLILFARDSATLLEFGRPVEAASALAARFWPGPLTLVVPLAAALPTTVTAGGPTIGLRLPDHPVARELLSIYGGPLATTSANRSGDRDPVTAEDVMAQLRDALDIVIDGGPCPLGVASTVLDLSREPPTILRRGAVSIEDIGEVVGHVVAQDRTR